MKLEHLIAPENKKVLLRARTHTIGTYPKDTGTTRGLPAAKAGTMRAKWY